MTCPTCDYFQRELKAVYLTLRLTATEQLANGFPVPADVVEGIAVCGFSLSEGVADA